MLTFTWQREFTIFLHTILTIPDPNTKADETLKFISAELGIWKHNSLVRCKHKYCFSYIYSSLLDVLNLVCE